MMHSSILLTTLLASTTLAADVATKLGVQFKIGQKFQIILDGTPDLSSLPLSPNADVFDIDVFDTEASTITKLKSLGKIVMCYFSAGTYEKWRSDAALFSSSDLGKALPDWPGEYWLKLSSPNVRNIMAARVKYAAQKGCDAIDPDNIDGYDNDNGIGLTKQDSIQFMTWLGGIAAGYGLKIGLKNAGAILPSLTNIVDFAVNEQCAQYNECNLYNDFLNVAQKPVFHIEYPAKIAAVTAIQLTSFCNAQGTSKMSTVLKDMDLDGRVVYCDGTLSDTKLVASVSGLLNNIVPTLTTSTISIPRITISTTTTSVPKPTCSGSFVSLQKCGGTAFTGCTTCPTGSSCTRLSNALSVCL